MMKKKDDTTKIADQILQDQIHREAKFLEDLLGPVTYQPPEGYSTEESIKKLRADREALRDELKAYEAAQKNDAKDVFDEEEYKNSESDKVLEINKVRKDKKTGRKKAGAFVKAAVLVLVAGTCIAGLSLQSEATRMWWMESLGWNIGGDIATQVDNDKERDYSEMPEWEAEAVIEQELGIQVPKFFYKPDRCEFSDYRYETITNQATLYYKIENEYISVNMIAGTDNYTSAMNFDGSIVQEEQIESSYGTIMIRSIRTGSDDKESVIAEWDYQDVHYEIFGRLPFEEVENVIKNMVL